MRFDAAVIGLGAVGSAAADALTRRGLKIIGFDAYDPPHAMGSSHGDTRLVRIAYAEGETYVPLARRAAALWLEANAASQEVLFHQDGVLYAGAESGSMITSVRQSAQRWGIALDARAEFPSAQIPDDWTVLFEPEGGYARPEAAIAFFLRTAVERGAALRTNTPVTGLERSGGRWRLRAAGCEVEADQVLIAAGGWAGGLRPGLASLLTIERRVHVWFDPAQTGMEQGRHPAFAFQDETGCWFYGAPALPGGRGVKLSPHHGHDPAESADGVDRSTHAADTVRSRRFAAQALPSLGPVIDQEACFYTLSPDGHFIVEDAVAGEGLMVIAGLSGHGFKFATALGEHAALRLCGEAGVVDLSVFSPARFG